MLKSTLLPTILFWVSTSLAAPGLRISCDDTVENYIIRAAFDSKAPVFFAEMVNQLEKPTKEEYLSKTQACGIKINFAQNCRDSVELISAENARYTFNCNNGIHGELELKSAQIFFSCVGPGVSANLHSLFFQGCKRH